MDEPTTYLRAMFATQVVLALLGGYRAYLARDQLTKYQNSARKLKDWTKDADAHVSTIRRVQFGSVLVLVFSLMAASILVVYAPSLPTWARIGGSPAMLLLTLLGRAQIKGMLTTNTDASTKPAYTPSFGAGKEAQSSMEDLTQVVEFLEYGWVATSFIAALMG